MNPNDLAADLPAPRDDEPESLQQDIVDELADHLQCSLQRELLASGRRESLDDPDSDSSAWQAVLSRFGSPAIIANRLWWDAMQEKIMAQRITAVMAGITAVAVVAMAVLLWRGIERQATAAAAMQESQRELVDRLVTIFEAQSQEGAEAPEDKAPELPVHQVELQLVLDEPGGPPAVGYEVINYGKLQEEGWANLVHPRTDEKGSIVLLSTRIGTVDLRIATPSGESSSATVPVGPEAPNTLELVVPSPRQEIEDVSIQVAVPDKLARESLFFKVRLALQPRTINGRTWHGHASLLSNESYGSYGGYGMEGYSHLAGGDRLQLLVSSESGVVGQIVEERPSKDNFDPRKDPILINTVPMDSIVAGDYEVKAVSTYHRVDSPRSSQDRLMARPAFAHVFREERVIKSASGESVEWTIELPDDFWQQLKDESGTALRLDSKEARF